MVPLKWLGTVSYLHSIATTGTSLAVSNYRVTTLQAMSNSLTVRSTRHVKCYSYHARISVTVSGGGRNEAVHDPKPSI